MEREREEEEGVWEGEGSWPGGVGKGGEGSETERRWRHAIRGEQFLCKRGRRGRGEIVVNFANCVNQSCNHPTSPQHASNRWKRTEKFRNKLGVKVERRREEGATNHRQC